MASDIPTHEVTGDATQGNQLRFLLDVGGQRWRLIFLFALIGALAWGIVGYLRVPKRTVRFEAYTDLLIRESPWDKPFMRDIAAAPLVRTTPNSVKERVSIRNLTEETVRALFQEDLQNASAWSGITSDEELRTKTDEILREQGLELVPDADAKVLRVKARAVSKGLAERLAEYAARIVIHQNREFHHNEEEEVLKLIQDQLESVREELEDAESREWDHRLQMRFRTKGNLSVEMEDLYSKLQQSRTRREQVINRLNDIEGDLYVNEQQFPDALGNVTDTVVSKMVRELEDLLSRQLSMSIVYTSDYPPMTELGEEIKEKREAILLAVDGLDSGTGGSEIWRRRQEMYRERLDMGSDLASLQIQIATSERMLTDMIADLPDLAIKDFEYQKILHERDRVRLQFKRLLDKEWSIRATLKRGSGRMERHNAVIVTPFVRGLQHKHWMNFIIGGLVGFLLGFALAVMLEALDTSIRSIEDVTRYIGLEVIGTIPKMRFGRPGRIGRRRRGAYVVATDETQIDACIVTQHDPKSPISESYRTLRTNFQFATINEKTKTVMVTSAVPGEGKTTTAVNMAVTMADSGMRVLLVDTDLRRPNIHRVLKMERGPGLADVLREGIDIQRVTRPTRIENLWIISSGRVPPNPSELIGSDLMRQVISKLGESFDIVICDAPSVLVVTDPVLLATHVDTMVLVVSANNARRETIQRAVKLMEAAKVKMAGVLLNGLETSRRHYYYYYYYYDDTASTNQRRWYHL